jgi:hypothetical protein
VISRICFSFMVGFPFFIDGSFLLGRCHTTGVECGCVSCGSTC